MPKHKWIAIIRYSIGKAVISFSTPHGLCPHLQPPFKSDLPFLNDANMRANTRHVLTFDFRLTFVLLRWMHYISSLDFLNITRSISLCWYVEFDNLCAARVNRYSVNSNRSTVNHSLTLASPTTTASGRKPQQHELTLMRWHPSICMTRQFCLHLC